MGKENETGFELPESSTLIDFLYVDKERVDSLISQLRNGTLRSVTKTIGASEGSSVSGKVTAAVAGGEYKNINKSESSAAQEFDPYHSQLINLLNDLEIIPLSNLPNSCDGKLALINGKVTIRDIASIKAVMPAITKNQKIFGIKDKGTRDIFKLMDDMIQQMSDSISLSINFNNISINGTLKENSLSIKQGDLLRTYGVNLPGTWHILGIIDSNNKIETENNTQVNTIENAIDAYASAMNTLYSQSLYRIIPILIFREISQ